MLRSSGLPAAPFGRAGGHPPSRRRVDRSLAGRRLLLPALGPLAAGLWLAGCAGGSSNSPRLDAATGVRPSPRVIAEGQPVPRGGGVYKLGEPYEIAGRWHAPAEEPNYDRVGVASWFGADFHGRLTANGEVFDQGALVAAHPTLPLPSYAYVTNIENGRTILVRINDRGPFARDRIIDLSRHAAAQLGFEAAGTAQIRVRYAGRAPLSGDDSHEQRFLAEQPWARTASRPALATSAALPPSGLTWRR